ncbi:hypothetical protein [Salegentibacter maritimus]|nr:hypothetical protein [Salegentibacter maritimus]MBI6117742.1 hypothetical protein [Salegentibacter maritimus]
MKIHEYINRNFGSVRDCQLYGKKPNIKFQENFTRNNWHLNHQPMC